MKLSPKMRIIALCAVLVLVIEMCIRDRARFARIIDKMHESKQAKLNTADIPSVVKLASSSFGITEAESTGCLLYTSRCV